MEIPNKSASFHRYESVGSVLPCSHSLTHCWGDPRRLGELALR